MKHPFFSVVKGSIHNNKAKLDLAYVKDNETQKIKQTILLSLK